MRPYSDKKNAQKKAYYSDRFFKAPPLPREKVDSDPVFAEDYALLSAKVTPKEAYIERGQMVLVIEPADLKRLMTLMKEKLTYDFLSEMSAVDFLADRGGFEIFYQLLSMSKRKRIRVKYFIKEGEAVESIQDIFKSADWAEREMYDMFGIYVNNHPYLKRLIMPDDWVGHPLLKSYPLQGDEAAQWYEIDTIFGKEYRDVVGPENRDPGFVDKKDTKNFVRIRHEVPYGAKPTPKPVKEYIEFQEEGGVKLFGIRLVTHFTKDNQETLKERK